MIPQITTLGPNFTRLDLRADLVVFYSYSTPIAFIHAGRRVFRANEWGPTTGRHLGTIKGGEDHKARVSGDVFNAELGKAVEG